MCPWLGRCREDRRTAGSHRDLEMRVSLVQFMGLWAEHVGSYLHGHLHQSYLLDLLLMAGHRGRDRRLEMTWLRSTCVD